MHAFSRAKELLGKTEALTDSECDDLERLFNKVSSTQFLALTQNPLHAPALRQYDQHNWRHGRRIIICMLVFFIFSVLMGIYVSLNR